jgi:hypothetical protein
MSVVTAKESRFQVEKKREKKGEVEEDYKSSPASIPSAVCVVDTPE